MTARGSAANACVGAFAGMGVLGLPGILLGALAITYLFELAALYRREYGNGHATLGSAVR